MTGHVIYACHCLNIGIHISKKYCIDGHEKYKRDRFVTLEEPAISGWKFELDKKGVIAKYPSLICARYNNDNALGWITFSCRNCNSGDIYSVKRPEAKLAYPIDAAIMSQVGDQVIIHKGAICGKEIDKIRKNTSFSSTFQIVLNPDLPVNYSSLDTEEDGELNTQLLLQQKQVQQILKESLIELKEITEKKIQLYQQEQERLLNREQDKAKYDGAVLWQTIKEISRTIKEEERFIKKATLNRSNMTSNTDSALSDNIAEERTVETHQKDLLEEEMSKRESHVQFSHRSEYLSHHNQHNNRRRSSAIKRDLFGGSAVPVSTHRRSSYILDESALAKSFKKDTHSSETVYELPSFRRRPSINPYTVQSIHPLAGKAPDDPEILESESEALPSNSSFLNGGDIEEEPNLKEDDEDSEDMFALDEEMEELDDDDLLTTDDRRLSSRRSSAKYINEDDMFDNAEQVRLRPEDATFASSLPISIIHSTPAYADSKIHPINVMYYPSSPSKVSRSRQKSFVGFDSAEADRETSSQLGPMDDNQRFRRKSSSAITLLNNKKNNHYKREYSDRSNIMNLNFFNEDEEEDEGGPMIPPHILAANTVTDETEAIFGSVPHNSVRHRPLE